MTASITNNDPTYPPTSNWQVYGDPMVSSFVVGEGLCDSAYTINVILSKNDADCRHSGSIIAQASGGVLPYQYSINGGITYQPSPIFNGLNQGVYTVYVQDSNNVVGISQSVQILSTPSTVYTLTLSVDYNANTFTITAPSLPVGVTITFNLTHNSTFTYYPNTLIPTPTYNNITTINTIGPMTLVNTSTNTYPLAGPCTADGPITVFQQSSQYVNTITMSSNQVLTGSITNNIINNPVGNCEYASGYYTLTISAGVANNCICCVLKTNNTTPPSQNPVQ